MRPRKIIELCNLIQACEWLLFYWEPVSTSDEASHIQRKRDKNYEKDPDYWQKAGILLSALTTSDEIHLFNKNKEIIVANHKHEALLELLKPYATKPDEEAFNILSYVTRLWDVQELYFSTEELMQAFKKGDEQEYFCNALQPTYSLSLENMNLYLEPSIGKRILIKTFNNCSAYRIISILMEQPNIPFYQKDLEQSIHCQRPDNVISKLKKEIKKTIEETSLPQKEKDNINSFINQSFICKNSYIQFKK